MGLKLTESILLFVVGALPFLYAIFVAYSFISEISDSMKMAEEKKKRGPGGINFNGDINEAILDGAIEEMAVTTVGECGGYIQNNNVFIEKQLKVFSPSFDARQFIEFAERLFEKLIKTRGTENIPLVSDNVDLMRLPYSVACFDGAYLHNYIICENTENIKLFCTVVTEADELVDSTKESYFLTFKRENPLISIKGGKFLTVSCPNCGGEIDIDKKMVSECPYCHSTVTFAEYDWILNNIEHIDDSTRICNMPLQKSNIY